MILEEFQLEPDCSRDSLTIYDGSSSSDTLIARLCGDIDGPVAYTSSSAHMYLEFVSDDAAQYEGFSGFFSAKPLPVLDPSLTSKTSACLVYIQHTNVQLNI